MRLIALLSFLLVGHFSYSQSFLTDYKNFRGAKIKANTTLDSIRKTDNNKILKLTKKRIKQTKANWLIQLDKQIIQFDTVFKTYKEKTGFDFNSANSLTIIYQTDIQSNLNKFIIISGKDTISYGERWKMLSLHSYEREIVYEPFLETTKTPGFVVIDDRDSLLTLVTKHDFHTAQKLAKKNPCSDGATSTIIIAKKEYVHYKFDELFLQPFIFAPIWRKGNSNQQ